MKTDTITILKGGVTYSTVMEATDCCVCGVPFAMPESLMKQRRYDGERFYCPNGHSLVYKDSDQSRLERRAKRAEEEARALRDSYNEVRMDLAQEKRSKAAIKGQLTKTKKRVGNGVCPCCNRHFVNLERHMKGQHPGYVEKGTSKTIRGRDHEQ